MKTHLKNITKIMLGKAAYHWLWKQLVNKPYNRKREKQIQDKNASSIMEYKTKFNPNIFIETGTYRGDMVNRMKDRFEKIYSIELGEKLWEKAVKRFAMYKHIEILHGDSAVVLPQLLKKINEPAIFWLDAHYSTGETTRTDVDTPVEKEVRTILEHPIKKHIIMIDDARCFTGKFNYPTRESLEAMVRSYGYEIDMQKDNFRIFPKN